jgi:hypothetical protein
VRRAQPDERAERRGERTRCGAMGLQSAGSRPCTGTKHWEAGRFMATYYSSTKVRKKACRVWDAGAGMQCSI